MTWTLCSLRREKFEALLSSYQADVDQFREREVPRQLDEINRVVDQLNTLGKDLEASKDEAMVSRS